MRVMVAPDPITALAPHLRKEHRLHYTRDSRLALKAFAAGLVKRRLQLDLKRVKVADAAGVSYSQLSHLELGNNWPTLPVYRALCRVLKLKKPPLL